MNRTSFRLRRAETNKALLIVLGVVAVLAVGYWGYQLISAEKPAPVEVSSEPVSFYCYECKKTFTVPPDQVSGLRFADAKYECNLCKKMGAVKGFGPSARMPQNP